MVKRISKLTLRRNFCGAFEDKLHNFCSEKLRNTLQEVQENINRLLVDKSVSKLQVDGLI